MAKSERELRYDRLRFGTLISASNSGMTEASLTITPPDADCVIVPLHIFAQAQASGTFNALDSIATLFNACPNRDIRVSRMDGEGAEIVGQDYFLHRVAPGQSALDIAQIEVAGIDSAVVKGAALKVAFDGIASGESKTCMWSTRSSGGMTT